MIRCPPVFGGHFMHHSIRAPHVRIWPGGDGQPSSIPGPFSPFPGFPGKPGFPGDRTLLTSVMCILLLNRIQTHRQSRHGEECLALFDHSCSVFTHSK
jgi:hypothetical protein